MKIELDFTQSEIKQLSHPRMKSFIAKQTDRFWPSEDVSRALEIEVQEDKGILCWCETLVDAKIFQTYWQQKGLTAILLGDEAEDFDYCVFLDVTMEKYGEVNDGVA